VMLPQVLRDTPVPKVNLSIKRLLLAARQVRALVGAPFFQVASLGFCLSSLADMPNGRPPKRTTAEQTQAPLYSPCVDVKRFTFRSDGVGYLMTGLLHIWECRNDCARHARQPALPPSWNADLGFNCWFAIFLCGLRANLSGQRCLGRYGSSISPVQSRSVFDA